jgi:hypothetical protein
MKLSNDLGEFIRDSNDDLLSKLTQNMFARHLVNYIEIELRCFDNICAMEIRKFYEGKNHQKKQTERFQDLKRDMQAIISARTNINIVQIDNYGGETFLSEELAINLLQESTAAFERCSVVSIIGFPLRTFFAYVILRTFFAYVILRTFFTYVILRTFFAYVILRTFFAYVILRTFFAYVILRTFFAYVILRTLKNITIKKYRLSTAIEGSRHTDKHNQNCRHIVEISTNRTL